MRDLATIFKALSDETRLEIMALLLENEELCVCDFVGALGLTQSKASRHLRYLYNAGLVRDRREGLWMHYRLSDQLTAQQRAVVEALGRALRPEQRRRLDRSLKQWLEGRSAEKC